MTKDEVKIFVSRLFCFFLQDQNTVGLRFQLLHCISMSIYIKSIDVAYVASKRQFHKMVKHTQTVPWQ